MFLRMLSFLFGFGLMVIGCTYLILYLNLTTIGYSVMEYFEFIVRRYETYYVVIGFIIVTLSIYTKRGKMHDLYL